MKKNKILVTGGLGYIGSHVVVELQNKGYDVVIIDNLSNSSIDVLDMIKSITGIKPIFEKIDLRDKKSLSGFFKVNSDIQGVIHFAALKAVGQSVNEPLLYYENNINSLIYLLQEIDSLKSKKLIFSSSCTVYGQADQLPINENAPEKEPQSPYGNTKKIGEQLINDFCKVNQDINAISLRYFNPIGAHASSKIGEMPNGTPQNLVPYITQTAAGKRESLFVYGNDYPTADGTCIRDYIHVVDLANAHVVAIQRLFDNENKKNYEFFNIGTGKGSSVFEVIETFNEVCGFKINYKVVGRRSGDVVSAFADTTKANNELKWSSKYSLKDALISAWNWEKKNILKIKI